MTKQEYNKCEKLMDEAIRNGKKTREEFDEAVEKLVAFEKEHGIKA